MAKQVKKKASVSKAAPFASYMRIAAEDQTEKDEEASRAEKEQEWAKKAESDPDREQAEDESDDDYATRMEEMDDEEEQAKTKAEGEIKDDPEAEEEKDDEKAKALRTSERVRCAKIVAYGIQSGNVNQSAVLAFDTNLSATQAISTMKAARMDIGSGNNNALGNRMKGVSNHDLGGHMSTQSKGGNKDVAVASSILDSVKAARGEGMK